MKITTKNSEHTERRIGECVNDVLNIKNIRRATAYISPVLTVKATAQHKIGKRDRSITVLVTVGAPNVEEQRFIKDCKKVGMCFPLRQIQWKFWKAKGAK